MIWNGSYVMTYLEVGIHQITLNVTDRFGNYAVEIMTVIVQPTSYDDGPNLLLIVPAGAIGLAFCLWPIFRKLKKR